MSLSKPDLHGPLNCRGCATFATFSGGEYFPPQGPGSPLAKCYELALAQGFIGTSRDSNAELVPAPLSIPPKSTKRPVGKPLAPSPLPPLPPYPSLPSSFHPSSAKFIEDSTKKIAAIAATVDEYEMMLNNLAEEVIMKQGKAEQARSKTPQINFATKPKPRQIGNTVTAAATSSSSSAKFYEGGDASYPLGHTYLPHGVLPLPNDPLFTVTTCGERCATTFVGQYAMRMYDAYRASGVEMRGHEVKGEWEKTGAKRWVYSLGMDKNMDKVKKILSKGRDLVAASERVSTFKLLKEYEQMGRAMEMGADLKTAFRNYVPDVEKTAIDGKEMGNHEPLVDGQLNTKCMERMINKVLEVKFDPLDYQGPDWPGSEASIFTLSPRQRPLRSCGIDGLVVEDEKDETACTNFVQLAPTKSMDFSWYHRRSDGYRREDEWPQQIKWTTSDGVIREFSMGQVYGGLQEKFDLTKRNIYLRLQSLNNSLELFNFRWQTMAKCMTVFDWYWDEEKRILVQGYSGHNDYEKDCDWIEKELNNWKESVEEGLAETHKARKSCHLTKKEFRYATIGEDLLGQWKKGPGIMVAKTPSDEALEGIMLGPHTGDGASHINYLTTRIADAYRQLAEIQSVWTFDTASEDVRVAHKVLNDHIKVLEELEFDIKEEIRQEETGQSPIFKDKKTRRELKLWEKDCRGEMALWERKPREEKNDGQSPLSKKTKKSSSTDEAIKLMKEMCGENSA